MSYELTGLAGVPPMIPPRLTNDSVLGDLRLTPERQAFFARTVSTSIYGENGPTNLYIGGRGEALKRLAAKCGA